MKKNACFYITFLFSFIWINAQYKRELTDADKINTAYFSASKKNSARLIHQENDLMMPAPINNNQRAAAASGIDAIRDAGLSLKGNGMTIALFEANGLPLAAHTEFLDATLSNTRIVIPSGNVCPTDTHATYVAGILTARGANNKAMGMSPESTVVAYDAYTGGCTVADYSFTGFLNKIKDEIVLHRSLVSNHSYGFQSGYYVSGGSWYWGAYRNIDYGLTTEDYMFGYYSDWDENIDQILYNAPYHAMFFSSGNENGQIGGSLGKAADCSVNGGYDCIQWGTGAKNVITIGAIKKNATYSTLGDIELGDFSSAGPTDDGRIKPDLVAVGTDIYTTNSAGSYVSGLYGTSFSTPVVTGGANLVQEHAKNVLENYLFGSNLKALLINSAGRAGKRNLYEGPSYLYGWGLFDAKRATEIITNTSSSSYILESQLTNGEVKTFYFLPILKRIKATLAWYDPEGTPTYTFPGTAGTADTYIQANPNILLDNPKKMLVNDLDMRMEQGGTIYKPWILNNTKERYNYPAERGDNTTDNVEGILISESESTTGLIKLTISHKGTLKDGAAQKFGLVIDGVQETTIVNVLTGTDFNNPANWSLGVIPTDLDEIYIDPSITQVEITKDTTLDARPLYIYANLKWIVKTGVHLTVIGGIIDEGYIKVEPRAHLEVKKP